MESKKFEQLVAQFEPMIFHLIKKLAIYKNKEEFYQIGLISIWEAWDKFQPQKGKYSSFLYQHMRGRFLDELKRNTKNEEQKCYIGEDFWELIESPALYLEEEHYIRSLCASLTPGEVNWVIYTFIHQLTVKEIAAKEHVSPSAVKWWKKGALEKLQKQMKNI